ncbi:MAG: carbohydrate kinase family protein [Chloroflexota bacterium]|nr:carbohydrate kinase family protein [Chloroflexota bacterium]
MNRLLVLGGATSDVLHLKDRTVESAGGAGMYTAMAARRCGAETAMFSARPDPCPESLKPVAEHLTEWLGPVISPAQLDHTEISYRGGETEYLNVSFDSEEMLTPSMLPADLSMYDLVHVIPLSDAKHQLSFIQACRQRGAKQISAGTWPGDAVERPQAVRAVIEQTDYFFMNNREAKAVFGSLESASTEAGKVLFVTLGAQGACIIQGDMSTIIPAVSTSVLDPTGAGDTFCGATLAYMLQKVHPIMAARHAIPLAAEMIEYVGPTALLSADPPPEAPLDVRVQANDGQVGKAAEKISTLSEASPFPFVGTEYPAVGHPMALDYFFAATLQQFSFWSVQDDRYDQPLIAQIGGVELKGSDYLWAAFTRRLEKDAEFCSPERQANLSREELLAVFRADNGEDPMPALDLHLEQAHCYGRDMLALQLTPQAVLGKALASTRTLSTFLDTLDQIGGYKEDPLRKKSSLLALILNQRTENFLPLRKDEQVEPVIDYHALRSCLRVGLIDVMDEELKNKLRNRQIVLPAEEWAVRYAAYRAIEQVTALSGKSTGAVDQFFFNSRSYCPEMSEPKCRTCQLDPVCAHRKELFQPVLRTSFY